MIDICYHLFYVNDAVERFKKTIQKIYESGLYDATDSINVNLTGENSAELYNNFPVRDPKIILTNHNENSKGETDTLKLLWDKSNQGSSRVLYLHSKGVTKPHCKKIQAWVDYMEYFLIENWKTCLDKLESFDTCGVNLCKYREVTHYSGNFWWANSSYIQRLKRFDWGCASEKARSLSTSHGMRGENHYAEFWLLDNDFCNPCNLFSLPNNPNSKTRQFCFYEIQRNSYRRLPA